jgi:hypothetical protein
MNQAQGLRQAMADLIAHSGKRAYKHDYALGRRIGQAEVLAFALGYDRYPIVVHDAAVDAVLRFCEIESDLDALYLGVMLDRQWHNLKQYVGKATRSVRAATSESV